MIAQRTLVNRASQNVAYAGGVEQRVTRLRLGEVDWDGGFGARRVGFATDKPRVALELAWLVQADPGLRYVTPLAYPETQCDLTPFAQS